MPERDTRGSSASWSRGGKRKHAPRLPIFLGLAELGLRRPELQRALEQTGLGDPNGLKDLRSLVGAWPRPSPPSCRTCAVVGGASSLRRGGAGPTIDGHDCVFRVNWAHTRGYEEDVGWRLTVHVSSLPAAPSTSEAAGLAAFARAAANASVAVLWSAASARRYAELAQHGELTTAKLVVVHPLQLQHLCEELGLGSCAVAVTAPTWRRPSTGLVAAHLAQLLCLEPPRLFGFDAHSVPFHYYEPEDTVCDAFAAGRLGGGGSRHDWSLEQQKLQSWQADGRLSLHGAAFAQAADVSPCALAEEIELSSADAGAEEVVGVYRAQRFSVNGRIVYERRRSGEDDSTFLYFTLCYDLDGGLPGIWSVLPAATAREVWRHGGGRDDSCLGMAASLDFRPEAPELATWRLFSSATGAFVAAPTLRSRATRRSAAGPRPGAVTSPRDYARAYDLLYEGYGYHAGLQLSHEHGAVHALLAYRRSLLPGAAPLSSALILGCSHGLGAAKLHAGGLKAFGVDVARRAVELATQTRGRTCGNDAGECFVRASLTNLPYSDATFDAALSADVLEHLHPDDVWSALREISRVVRQYLVVQIASFGEVGESGHIAGLGDLHLTVQNSTWWAIEFVSHGWHVIVNESTQAYARFVLQKRPPWRRRHQSSRYLFTENVFEQ